MDELETYYFGKYRGKVIRTDDPMNMGRLQVQVIDVLGNEPLWAMPCVPYAGPGVGFFFLPPVGGDVWVEFERGDPGCPIWTGAFWGPGMKLPVKQSRDASKALKTEIFSLAIESADKKSAVMTVEMGDEKKPKPLTITLNDAGIEIANQQVVIRLKGDVIEVTTGPKSSIAVREAGVDVKCGGATLSARDGQISGHGGAGDLELSSGGVSLSSGASNVKIATDGVTVNDGALKVV